MPINASHVGASEVCVCVRDVTWGLPSAHNLHVIDSYVNITQGAVGGPSRPVYSEGGGDEGGQPSSLLRPLSMHFHRGPRPAGAPDKAPTLCSPSSLSPDSCRLLTSSTWRQWGERETGADWCTPACQWRFLPLPFLFLSPRLLFGTKQCIQKRIAHSSLFPVTQTASETCYI